MKKHSQLIRLLGLEKFYAKLVAPQYDVTTLSSWLPGLPIVLVEIIVEYGHLHLNNSDDFDESYNRLLQIDEY